MDRLELELWTGREVGRLLALLESRSVYYQEILASFPVGAVIVSNQGGVLSSNRAFRQLIGVRSEDLHRRKLNQVLSSKRLDDSVSRTLEHGTAESGIPVRILGRTLQAAVNPVRGQDDDIEALVTLEETSSAVLTPDVSDVPGLVWALHPGTLIFDSVEGPNEHLLGYSREHWLNTPNFWLERVHAADRPQVDQFYNAALASGGEFACEFRAVTANGSTAWRRDAFRVSLDESGRVTRISGLTTDIDSRRQSDLDSVQANRVEALAELSRRLSHDLNNALMIVTGYGEELLSSLPENDARRSDVRAILSAADMMASTAGELHGFTRKQASPPAATNVSELLTEAAARIRQELGATPVLRLPQTQLNALADATQLEAAVVSIARRLRDKTDPHMIIAGAEVTIKELSSVTHALKPGPYIEIAVRGPYVSEIPAAAFETFLSGKDSHGSDMARTYAIIREWGGTILTGRTENTSEVRVLLPATAFSQPVVKRAESPQPAGWSMGPRDDFGTVLVVEDEKGIRELVRRILTREGYKVLEAGSAEQALEVARNSAPIRLLLTDLTLPGKSGRELAEELALTQPNLRVLYISGYTNDAAVIDSRGTPGSALLQKPFTLAALLKKVHEALSLLPKD